MPLSDKISNSLLAILCTVLIVHFGRLIYDRLANPGVLEIVYDNGKYNKIVLLSSGYWYAYIVKLKNISAEKTINSVSVLVDID
jgi:hypothetical protein